MELLISLIAGALGACLAGAFLRRAPDGWALAAALGVAGGGLGWWAVSALGFAGAVPAGPGDAAVVFARAAAGAAGGAALAVLPGVLRRK